MTTTARHRPGRCRSWAATLLAVKRYTVHTDSGAFVVHARDALAARRKIQRQGHTVRDVRERDYTPPQRPR